jgi:hypothetical protein
MWRVGVEGLHHPAGAKSPRRIVPVLAFVVTVGVLGVGTGFVGTAMAGRADAPPAKARVVVPRSTPPALILKGRGTKKIAWRKLPVKVSWDGRRAGNINPSLRAVYRGQTLYKLIGFVDGGGPSFNVALARRGYKIQFRCKDGYRVSVSSKRIVGKKRWIIARLRNGQRLGPTEAPYRFVGSFIRPFNGKLSARMIVQIRLIF